MAEVNLRSWPEISQAANGLQLNPTDAAMLEHILARMARIGARLDENDRRLSMVHPPPRPEPDPPDVATLYTAEQLPYQPPSPPYQPTTKFQQPHVVRLPQHYLQPTQPYQPPAPPPDDLQWQQPQPLEMQDWRWQSHQPHTLPVQTQRRTSWDLPSQHHSVEFRHFDQPPFHQPSCWAPPQAWQPSHSEPQYDDQPTCWIPLAPYASQQPSSAPAPPFALPPYTTFESPLYAPSRTRQPELQPWQPEHHPSAYVDSPIEKVEIDGNLEEENCDEPKRMLSTDFKLETETKEAIDRDAAISNTDIAPLPVATTVFLPVIEGGKPTRACLFSDPIRKGTGLLKLWNMNGFNEVLWVFNCQGATKVHLFNIGKVKLEFFKRPKNHLFSRSYGCCELLSVIAFDPGGDTSPKFLLLMFFVVTWFPP